MQLIRCFIMITSMGTLSIHPMEERIEKSIRSHFYSKNYASARALAKQLSPAKSKAWLDTIEAAEKGIFTPISAPQEVRATIGCPPCTQEIALPAQAQCPPQIECPICPPQIVCPPQIECPPKTECPPQIICPPQIECPPKTECPPQIVCPQITPREGTVIQPTVSVAQALARPIKATTAQEPTIAPPQEPTTTIALVSEPTAPPTEQMPQKTPPPAPIRKGPPPAAPKGKAPVPKTTTLAIPVTVKKEQPKTFDEEYPKPAHWQDVMSTLTDNQREVQKSIDLLAQSIFKKVQSGEPIKIADSIEYKGRLSRLPEGDIKQFYSELEKKLTTAKPLVISKKELTTEQQKLKSLSSAIKATLVKSLLAEYKKTIELFNTFDVADIYWNNATKGDVEIHDKVANWIFQYKQTLKNILLNLDISQPGEALEKIDLPIFEQRKRYALSNRTKLTTDKSESAKKGTPKQLDEALLPSSGIQVCALITPELLTVITVSEDDIKRAFADFAAKKISVDKAKIILKNMIKTFNTSNPTETKIHSQEYQKLFNEDPLL